MVRFNKKNVENAPDKIKAGAEEMIKAPMWLIEQILLKHEKSVLEVMKELHDENAGLKGECMMLADVLRDAFEVIKTVEGEDSDECDKLQDLRISIEYALGAYDDRRVSPNAEITGADRRPG